MVDEYSGYRQKAQARMEQYEARAAAMRAKVKEATADMKIGLEKKLHDIDRKIADGRREMEMRKADGSDGWERFRDKMEDIFHGIEDSLKS